MAPTLDAPTSTGLHQMYFRVYMNNYAGYVDIPFVVTVTDCAPSIDSSGVRIPVNFSQPWGADATILNTVSAF